MMKEDWTQLAREHDAKDPLAALRERFYVPLGADGRPAAYLCGHSLGLCPKTARELVEEEFEDWATLGVEAHTQAHRPWVSYHEELTGALARLVGAREREVVAMNSLSTNLHLMMVSFYRPTRERRAIVIEKSAFPSDRQAVVSQLEYHGYRADDALIELAPREGETTLREEDIEAAIVREGGRVALVLWPGVQYLTGQAFDLARIARAAHAAGALAGFDLAHAIGNLVLSLHDADADFAVWCSYKYLNGGPGAPGGCFVHERHGLDFKGPRFAGWWGHDKQSRFAMGPEFVPIPGAEGWQLSNPPVFALAPLLASLRIFDEAGIANLRTRSLALTGFLCDALVVELGDAVEIITPEEPAAHGAQLSLRLHKERGVAHAAFEALAAHGVIADWREPNVIRVAPAPLYNRYEDCARLVEALHETLRRAG
ncbi:MAG: kynureninase [Gammaproteobacteria bacterium]